MPLSPLHFSQHYKRNTEVINIGEKWNSHLLTKVVAATPFKAVCPFKVPFWLNLKGVNVIIYFLKSEYRIFYIKHPPPPISLRLHVFQIGSFYSAFFFYAGV